MKALIAKLEAATEGSRVLDCFIAYGLHPDFISEADCAPHYTTSIDAALTLVPERAVWALSCNDEYPGLFRGTVMPRLSDDNASDATVHAPTPALALCIAALKAREEELSFGDRLRPHLKKVLGT